MNRYQKVVILVAALTLGCMLLFPPMLEAPLRRGTLPGFDGFRPVWELAAGRRLYGELLSMQIMFVAANALAAWLVLDQPAGRASLARQSLGIGLFAAANVALIALFPPYETYSGILRQPPGFDGFYFVFGERTRRALYTPMLHLELLLVATDALLVWLGFSVVRRRAARAQNQIMALARELPPEELLKVSEQLLRQLTEDVGGAGRPPRAPPPGERPAGAERRRRPRA